jgi:phosphonate degradation associated HDIG domain protein
MRDLVDDIVHLFRTQGSAQYGAEPVSQLEHAVQCAALAEEEGAGPELVAASLLHDFGHLMYASVDSACRRALDDRHEYRPVRMLRRYFGDAVVMPIRLHVAAKRYLCAVDPDYRGELSAASLHSLALQGGSYTPAEVTAFIVQPYARDAIRLRTWDDRAKMRGRRSRDIAEYVPLLMECAHGSANSQSAA